VAAEARCRYGAPARFGDLLHICTSLKQARRNLIAFAYQVANAETGQLLATGETVHLVTAPDLQPRPLPQKYRALFGM